MGGREVKIFVICLHFSVYFFIYLLLKYGFEYYCTCSCLFTFHERHYVLCQGAGGYNDRALKLKAKICGFKICHVYAPLGNL